MDPTRHMYDTMRGILGIGRRGDLGVRAATDQVVWARGIGKLLGEFLNNIISPQLLALEDVVYSPRLWVELLSLSLPLFQNELQSWA